MSDNVQRAHSACQAHCAPGSLDANPLNLHICRMITGPFHRYLKAWRIHKDMTQEAVGSALGVRHTTVGRWESGSTPINTYYLTRLAALYEIAPPERILQNPSDQPDSALAKAGEILSKLDNADLADWLRHGDRLTRR